MEAFIIIYVIVTIVTLLILLISRWKIFTKANQPGWAVLVPIYNTLVFLKVIGKPWWWLIMFVIPFVNLIFLIWALNMLSKSFGKGTGFTVGLVLLPLIFYAILGFGSAKYLGPAGESS